MASKKKIINSIYKTYADYPAVLGTNEISSMLGVKNRKVQELVRTGELQKLPSSRSIKVLKDVVIEYIIQHL